jgi:phosphohistidine phosphatase SixA
VDKLRPLSAEGRRRTQDGAVGLRSLGVKPQQTLCSPLDRARQTAEIIHKGLKLVRPIEFVDSLAGWRLSSIIADASTADVESVLLVGHEPTLSELIGLLIGGRQASISLRPA